MTETAPHHYGPVVERLDVSAYRIPTALPGGDATLTWNSTTLVLVKAAAAGEPQAKPGPVRPAAVIEHELADLALGHDVFDVPAVNDRMSRALRNVGRPGIAAGAPSPPSTPRCGISRPTYWICRSCVC